MPKKLTPEMLKLLQETFRNFDLDSNGFIDRREMENMLGKMKIPYTAETIKKTMDIIDYDQNGYIDFEEFVEFMQIVQPDDRDKELKAIFDKVDVNRNGVIEKEELKALMVSLGHVSLSEAQLQDMLVAIDANSNQLVEFREFSQFMEGVL